MSKSFTLIEVIIILVILSLMIDLSLLLIRMDYEFVSKFNMGGDLVLKKDLHLLKQSYLFQY